MGAFDIILLGIVTGITSSVITLIALKSLFTIRETEVKPMSPIRDIFKQSAGSAVFNRSDEAIADEEWDKEKN